jgi:hypothetical protein
MSNESNLFPPLKNGKLSEMVLTTCFDTAPEPSTAR